MNNKIITAISLSICSCYTPFVAAAKGKKAEKNQKPNVILFYGDDMGKGMLSVYGQPWLKTPNMDKVINQGVQFNNAYGCHYSAPARAALLTGYNDCTAGKWLLTAGKNGNYIVADTALVAPVEAKLNAQAVRLEKNDEYLPEMFKKAGYYTGQIGKLEYGFVTSRHEMVSHGWDYFYGFLDHGRCHGFYPPFLFDNHEIAMIEGNTLADCGDVGYSYHTEEAYRKRLDPTGKKHYSQDIFNDKIEQFIHQHKDEPFFLYHPSQLPHGTVSVPYIHEDVKYMQNLNPVEKEYATMILLLDEALGKILATLDELNIADNTMIIFSVDNGHEIHYASNGRTSKTLDIKTGEKVDNSKVRFTSECVGDIFNGNMGLTGKKRSNLEGGVSVPLSYYFPSKLKPYANNQVVANYDMIATLAEMLQVEINSGKDAKSYYKMLSDSTVVHPANHYAIVDSKEGPAIIMNDGWKLRYDNVPDSYELFYLTEDKKEQNNLAAKYPEKYEELRQILIKEVEKSECRGGYTR